MIKLSQYDKRWAKATLGSTTLTIARWGCTLTCVSMLSDWYSKFKGRFFRPDELAKKLQFTPEGLLIWGSIPKVLPFGLEKRSYKVNHEEIRASLKGFYTSVILNVHNGGHWVLAVKALPFNAYLCVDPLGGKFKIFKSGIVGSAHFNHIR